MASGIKLSYEEVKRFFQDQGCELLESEYKNARTKMRYRCACGNEAEIVFCSFKVGNRCRNCGNKKNSDKQSFSQKEAAEKFKKLGCELIGTYVRSGVPVEFKCHCGRISKALPNNVWKRGRCGECGIEARSGSGHYMWYDDRDAFKLLRSFKDRCHKLIYMVYDVAGKVKNDNTAKLLGYDYRTLQSHIKSHPNWNEVKNKKWHIDHIFPIKAFLEHGISDLKIINALDNLRPLDAKQNLCKNAKYDKDEFYKWLQKKGIFDVTSCNGI